MHREILSESQQKLFPLLSSFSPMFGLVGGTAIALHVGHRKSIDFDLFSVQSFDAMRLKNRIREFFPIEHVLVDDADEFTFVTNGVKITFFHYPFLIVFNTMFDSGVMTTNLLTLAAMKAYALGRRAKWKDYVDIYAIVKYHHSFAEVIGRAEEIFGKEFNEKIFRSQLSYFDDIRYDEQVEYVSGWEVDDEVVKRFLIEVSLS